LDDEVKLGLDSVTDMFAKNDMGLGLYTPVQYCIIPGQGMNLLQQYQPWMAPKTLLACTEILIVANMGSN